MAYGYNISQRKINKRNHIIDLFRQHTILSKAKAKKLSAYSMDTIISIFSSLLDDHIIIPTEGTQKAKGRKANFFTLNNDKRVYLGITFNQACIISSLVSFSQDILSDCTTKLKIGISKEDFLISFKNNIEDLLIKASIDQDSISAVGCSVPGDIDIYSGVLRSYTLMPQLAGLNFRELAESVFSGIPVIIDHNIRSMTSYLVRDVELIENYEKILFISARSGNANGFIQGGKLVIGHGEMGHVRVSDENIQCICGRNGCLDCYFSLGSFTSIIPGIADVNETLDLLTEKYATGEPVVSAELNRRLYYFASALLDVINVTAPDITVLSGDLFKVYGDPVPRIKKIVQEKFRSSGYVTHFQNAEIIYRELGTDIAALGICYEMIKNDWGYYREDKKRER